MVAFRPLTIVFGCDRLGNLFHALSPSWAWAIAPAFAQAPANGNTPPATLTPAQMQQMQEMQAKMEAYQEAAQRMEAHIHLGRDKLLHLDVKSGEEIGVDPEIFAQLKGALEHTNDLLIERQISIGEVAFSNNRNIFGREVALQRVDGNAIEGFSTPGLSCAGWTGILPTWWGMRIYLNECDTQSLLNALVWGSSAVVVIGGIDLTGLIGGMYYGIINQVDQNGGHRGIYIDLALRQYRQIWIGHQ